MPDLLFPDLLFGEYRPDVSDRNQSFTGKLMNVLPRADGYGPVKGFSAFSAALPARCRGIFFARTSDGSVMIFAATSDRLYRLDNTSLAWSDVSRGGTAYTAVDSTRNWRFAQFNNFVFAANRNENLQVFDLTSSSTFANASGPPPKAGWVTTVGRFLVLCDLLDYPYRVQWSGLNNVTQWTSGTNYSDAQDLPTGGVPRAIAGGELGVIVQDNEVRRMIYQPGSDVVFQIDKIAERVGTGAPDSVVSADNLVFFLSSKGFVQMQTDGAMSQIGLEQVDRTFAEETDIASPQYIQGSVDPITGLVIWSHPLAAASTSGFSRLLAYNYRLNPPRWSPIEMAGEYIASLAQPGLTLEALDALAPGALPISGVADNGSGAIRITVASTATLATGNVKTISGVGGVTAANGTWTITVIDATTFDLNGSAFSGTYTSGGVVAGSVDAFPTPFDEISSATLTRLALADMSHAVGFLGGDSLEATIETSEQQLADGRRVRVNGLRPVTDASAAFASVIKRDNMHALPEAGEESAMDDDGFCPVLEETRLARGRLRIPAGESWTFASGIEPDFSRSGRF